MDNSQQYFIWVRVNGNFYCQKINHDGFKHKLRHVLDCDVFKKELTEQEKDLTLDQLAVKYPAPERNENV